MITKKKGSKYDQVQKDFVREHTHSTWNLIEQKDVSFCGILVFIIYMLCSMLSCLLMLVTTYLDDDNEQHF